MRGMCHDVATYKKPIYKNQEVKIKLEYGEMIRMMYIFKKII